MKVIDAFGKQCPMPLMMAKRELDAGECELGVKVDNETAVKNLTRLANKRSLSAAVEEIEGGWLVKFVGEGQPVSVSTTSESGDKVLAACATTGGSGYAVFVGKDFVGDGDITLGHNLMKMAIYTLSECGDAPVSLLFMNAGVKLVAGPDKEQQVVDAVCALEEQGTEVLVCGTCLDFFGLKDDLACGEVSNMYDILERMREAAKVITL